MSVNTLSLEYFRENDTREAFIKDLRNSLESTGFVRITNHGLNANTIEQAYSLIKQLFELPLEVKRKYQLEELGLRGYTGFGKERAKDQKAPDLKEFWHVGKDLNQTSRYLNRYPKNVWPNEIPDFELTFKLLFLRLEEIALELLNAIGEGFNMPPHYFPELINDGNSVLRLIHYPAVQGLDTNKQMRAAAHADINLMTLLVGATDSGLQLLDKQGDWVDVETNQNEIVVDTGDMMARITGHTLPATVHRVINPSNSHRARYSMPFFLHPHSDAVLQRLPMFKKEHECENDIEPRITAGDFLNQRLSENGLA